MVKIKKYEAVRKGWIKGVIRMRRGVRWEFLKVVRIQVRSPWGGGGGRGGVLPYIHYVGMCRLIG